MIIAGALLAGVVVAGLFAFVVTRVSQQQPSAAVIRVSGLPASVPTSLANLMALSPAPVRPPRGSR
jgi:hypothetical protein